MNEDSAEKVPLDVDGETGFCTQFTGGKRIPSHKDTPYSWVVCLAAFTSSFMTVGFSHAIGIYFVVFRDIFEETAGVTSWVSSLNYGVLCMSGKFPALKVTLHRK